MEGSRSILEILEDMAILADDLDKIWKKETDYKGSAFFGSKHNGEK